MASATAKVLAAACGSALLCPSQGSTWKLARCRPCQLCRSSAAPGAPDRCEAARQKLLASARVRFSGVQCKPRAEVPLPRSQESRHDNTCQCEAIEAHPAFPLPPPVLQAMAFEWPNPSNPKPTSKVSQCFKLSGLLEGTSVEHF